MLHAAAMLIGTCILWLLATQRWNSAEDFAIAACAASACVLIAARLGGVGGGFARAPQFALLALARAGPVVRGALATLRSALAADVTLKPALVRVRTRASSAAERAAFANMISATPGMAVVDTDADGLLVHVTNEDAIDAADLGRLEHLVMKGGTLT
jgi:multisubunit Na+/H+ antiporter MnhE subunit